MHFILELFHMENVTLTSNQAMKFDDFDFLKMFMHKGNNYIHI